MVIGLDTLTLSRLLVGDMFIKKGIRLRCKLNIDLAKPITATGINQAL